MNKNLKLQIYILFAIILSNFIAQIPYTIHLYGVGRLYKFSLGWLAMLFVLLLFLFGFVLLMKRKVLGYWLLFAFLLMEFLFYLYNETFGLVHGYGIPYHLLHDDPILKVVFLIGFLNLFASGYFLFLLLHKREELFKK